MNVNKQHFEIDGNTYLCSHEKQTYKFFKIDKDTKEMSKDADIVFNETDIESKAYSCPTKQKLLILFKLYSGRQILMQSLFGETYVKAVLKK